MDSLIEMEIVEKFTSNNLFNARGEDIMCGYCIEEGIVYSLLEDEQAINKVDFLAPIFILESHNYFGTMTKIRNLSNFSRLIDVVFCRVWETLINEENDDAYQRISIKCGADTIDKFLSKIKGNQDHPSWHLLGDSNLYLSESNWKMFIDNKELLIRNSENTLALYHKWWIQGGNKETSDPGQRLEETGMMDPIDNTAPKEWDKFYSSFPFVFFSLNFLLRHKDSSDIIKKIALGKPSNVPDFSGYDLFLQRKAFAVCVKKYGVSFIIENYDDIRLELIGYVLLKKLICNEEMVVLKEHLLSHSHWVMGMNVDEVQQLITTNNHR